MSNDIDVSEGFNYKHITKVFTNSKFTTPKITK